jgi:hypothetical protein
VRALPRSAPNDLSGLKREASPPQRVENGIGARPERAADLAQ